MSVELDNPDGSSIPFAEAPGVTPATDRGGAPGFVTDVIVELGFADRAVVDEAVEESRLRGKMPETILLASEIVDEDQLARATAERNGMPFVDLAEFTIDAEAQRLIDTDTARRYRASPIAFDSDGALIVALADPLDGLAVSDISVITKSEVRPAVATDAAIDRLLSTLPPSPIRRLVPASVEDDAEPDEPGAWKLSQSITSADEAPPTGDLEAELASERGTRARIERERDHLRAERDVLAAERDALTAERDELVADRERLAAAREDLERADPAEAQAELRARIDSALEASKGLGESLDQFATALAASAKASGQVIARHRELIAELERTE